MALLPRHRLGGPDGLSLPLVSSTSSPNNSFSPLSHQVERVTKTKLNDYIAEHIFKHLNITDTTFHLPDSARRSTLWMRTEAGPLAPAPHIVPSPIPDAHGGAGLYASAPSLLAVYAAVLRQDPEILKAETWRMMFTEQLRTGGKGLDDLEKYGPEMRNNALGSLPDGVGRGFGFGGILVREDTPGRRAKGSMSWSGLPNCYWVSDLFPFFIAFCMFGEGNDKC